MGGSYTLWGFSGNVRRDEKYANNNRRQGKHKFPKRCKESVFIPEGQHPAKISKVEVQKRGKENYEYLDVHVELLDVETKEGKHPSIKLGQPFDLTPNTKLGKLLKSFGVTDEEISSGKPIDIEGILSIGKEVKILTKDKESDKMFKTFLGYLDMSKGQTFAEIVSMKPA